MTGPIRLKTKLNISPGDRDIADRMRLAGTFHIPTGYFTNEKLQARIDNLSLRGLGEPKLIGKEEANITEIWRASFCCRTESCPSRDYTFKSPGLTRI